MDDSRDLVSRLATTLLAPEAAVKLLLSIVLGHPISLFHRYFLYGKNPILQHVYFAVCGLAIGIFNFEWDVLHTFVTIICVYLILRLFGGTLLSAVVVLVFTMVYLLTGYYMKGAETYINWTMPYCVLTLRLTGLAFDLYDGTLPPESLSTENKKVALSDCPSFLEILAHSYFPASFLVGPQFSMKKYQDFVYGKFRVDESCLPACLGTAAIRTLVGVIYLAVYQLGHIYFPDDYLISEQFVALGVLKRLFYTGIWGHIILYKYISIWLLVEGVCIEVGLAYNGEDEEGNPKWDGCENVNLFKFENATKFNHYVESFNINTNRWLGQYIFKRLKFLGNRYISLVASLLFLAAWHGLQSGYYMSFFFLEFCALNMEKDLDVILSQNKRVLELMSQPRVSYVASVVQRLYVVVFLGYSAAPFILLSADKWFAAHRNTYFIGHVVWAGWLVYRPLVKWLLPPTKSHKS